MEQQPILKFNDFKECIDFYHKYRKTEYEIGNNIKSAHNNLIYYQGLGKVIDESKNRMLVDDFAVERFHPSKIDNKEFWTYAKQKFPKFSVCGGKSKSIKHCNEQTLGMAKRPGFINFINKKISESSEKLNFFEIGYGHGNIFFEYKDKVNYTGIDYYKITSLKKYKNLLTIDKSGVPDEYAYQFGTYDIVYSVNVLQHCSFNDRWSYIDQASRMLKSGGYFIGSCFLHTEDNKDTNVWSMVDKDGRYYCNFFNQLTEVDTHREFSILADRIGYDAELALIEAVNCFFFILKKR